jgi:hypothetical protein
MHALTKWQWGPVSTSWNTRRHRFLIDIYNFHANTELEYIFALLASLIKREDNLNASSMINNTPNPLLQASSDALHNPNTHGLSLVHELLRYSS